MLAIFPKNVYLCKLKPRSEPKTKSSWGTPIVAQTFSLRVLHPCHKLESLQTQRHRLIAYATGGNLGYNWTLHTREVRNHEETLKQKPYRGREPVYLFLGSTV